MSYASAMIRIGVELPRLAPGDSGRAVSALQALLGIAPTGVYDAATTEALVKAGHKEVDQDTWRELWNQAIVKGSQGGLK